MLVYGASRMWPAVRQAAPGPSDPALDRMQRGMAVSAPRRSRITPAQEVIPVGVGASRIAP